LEVHIYLLVLIHSENGTTICPLYHVHATSIIEAACDSHGILLSHGPIPRRGECVPHPNPTLLLCGDKDVINVPKLSVKLTINYANIILTSG